MATDQHQIIERAIISLRPYARNARTHSKRQIKQIADLHRAVRLHQPGAGFRRRRDHRGARHGSRPLSLLGMEDRCRRWRSRISRTTERRAYVLADNKLALNAGWDAEILAIELQGLIRPRTSRSNLPVSVLAEIELSSTARVEADPEGSDAPEDECRFAIRSAGFKRSGDLWQLGRHRLLCGDARSLGEFKRCWAPNAQISFSLTPRTT